MASLPPARPTQGGGEGATPPQDAWHLLELAAIHTPDALAVVDCGASPARLLTYQQLYDRSAALAGWLRAAGLRRGDRLGLLARNCSAVMEVHFAAAALHAVVVNLNIHLAPRELAFIFRDSAPRLLFADRQYAGSLLAAAAEARGGSGSQGEAAQQELPFGSVVWIDIEGQPAPAQQELAGAEAEAAAWLVVSAADAECSEAEVSGWATAAVARPACRCPSPAPPLLCGRSTITS